MELNGATADIAANLAPLAIASAKSIELVHADQPIYLRSSNFALRAALGNLIENAINHTPVGTSVCLRVTSGPSIEVTDSGPGIMVNNARGYLNGSGALTKARTAPASGLRLSSKS